MHTPHSKDLNKYNGPKTRRFAPGIVSRLSATATQGAMGFDSRQAAESDALATVGSGFTVGEWPTPWGVEYDWYK
jgi:hypothetical protein